MAVDSTTDEVIAYDTTTYSELFRIPIGEEHERPAPGSLRQAR